MWGVLSSSHCREGCVLIGEAQGTQGNLEVRGLTGGGIMGFPEQK